MSLVVEIFINVALMSMVPAIADIISEIIVYLLLNTLVITERHQVIALDSLIFNDKGISPSDGFHIILNWNYFMIANKTTSVRSREVSYILYLIYGSRNNSVIRQIND